MRTTFTFVVFVSFALISASLHSNAKRLNLKENHRQLLTDDRRQSETNAVPTAGVDSKDTKVDGVADQSKGSGDSRKSTGGTVSNSDSYSTDSHRYYSVPTAGVDSKDTKVDGVADQSKGSGDSRKSTGGTVSNSDSYSTDTHRYYSVPTAGVDSKDTKVDGVADQSKGSGESRKSTGGSSSTGSKATNNNEDDAVNSAYKHYGGTGSNSDSSTDTHRYYSVDDRTGSGSNDDGRKPKH